MKHTNDNTTSPHCDVGRACGVYVQKKSGTEVSTTAMACRISNATNDRTPATTRLRWHARIGGAQSMRQRRHAYAQKIDDVDLEMAKANVSQLLAQLPEAIEGLARHALRASGAAGGRRYAAGQWLSVRHDGCWRDAEILDHGVDVALLRFDGEGEASLALHPWNHSPRELPL